jgi:hypothetical protein
MDGQRFDRMARALATRAGRRAVLKALAGGMVATFAGLRGASAATLKPTGKRCYDDAQCASGF